MANELTVTQQQRLGEILKDIQHSQRRVGLEVLTIGQRLLEAKDILWHGDFEDWVETNCRFSTRTAENMMNVARRLLDKPEVISLLPPGILYQLAAPSTNEKVIDVIATRIRDGETLDNADVEKVIRDNRRAHVNGSHAAVHDAAEQVRQELLATGGHVSVDGASIEAAITEHAAEAVRPDNDLLARKLDQEDGVEGWTKYKGLCPVDFVDRGGRVTLFAPELVTKVRRGMKIRYIIFVDPNQAYLFSSEEPAP